MDGFLKLKSHTVEYDPKKDGVWIYDGDTPMAFLPRNAIIALVSELPPSPPKGD